MEIKEAILKNLTEISKHYSIRATLLNRKLLSKIMKCMYDHVLLVFKQEESSFPDEKEETQIEPETTPGDKTPSDVLKLPTNGVRNIEVRVLQSFIGLIVSLASIINTRFYIPGETKEVESLRRKAIMNGVLIFVQALITLIISRKLASEPVKEAFRKLQTEVLENVELQDFRLHVYTVFHIMKHRIDHKFEGTSFVILVNDEEKTNLVREHASIAQDKLFIGLKATLEAIFHSKGLKIKIPSFFDSLNDFLNSDYLRSTFLRYKKLIEHTNNPQPHIISSQGDNKKKHVRNLIKQASQ